MINDNWIASEGAPSNAKAIWKRIWGAKVLPRVNSFAWCACFEALPTSKGLSRRIASMEASCKVCGVVEEDGLHALFWCGLARGMWS